MGVSVSETKAEITTVIDTTMANSRNSRPTMPPISSKRYEHRDQRDADRNDCEADFAGALQRGLHRRMPSSIWR